MTSDEQTIAAYEAHADRYRRTFDKRAPDVQLAAFIDGVPERGRVLDLGCGTGRSSALMKNAGLNVDALDATQAFVDLAKQSFDVDVTLGTFDALDADGVYEGIFANFSLLHAPRRDLPDHLARIARALKPGGLFHIGLKTGKGDARDTLGRFYTYYTDAEITARLTAAGFTVANRWVGAGQGLDGTVAPWIVLHARVSA